MQVNKPTFIGIGVQKAGSTWLAHMLRMHPQVFLAPAKEIHYFDRDKKYSSPNFLNYRNWNQKLFNKEQFKFFVGGVLSGFKWLLKGNIENFIWRMKFHFNSRPSYDWYLSLFKTKYKYLVKGEITPAYSILEEQDISLIKSIDDNLKIIIILRNPIERAWSSIRYEYTNGHIDINDKKVLQRIISSESFSIKNRYSTVIEKWSKYFSDENFLMLYYDDIQENPKNELIKVFSFLKVDNNLFDFTKVSKRVNVSKTKEMPGWVKDELVQSLSDELKILSEKYGGRTKEWYKMYHI